MFVFVSVFLHFFFSKSGVPGRGLLLPLTNNTYAPFHKFNGVSISVVMLHKVQQTRLEVVYVVMAL